MARALAELLHSLIEFVARHPELNRMMVYESTSPGPRLEWLVENLVRPYYESMKPLWKRLACGDCRTDSPVLMHHVLIGATSL